MEIFTKKSLVLKIVIALVIVILFNFSAPTISQADVTEVIGGTLLTPIVDLLLAIGDGMMNLIQNILFGMDTSLVKVAIPEAGFWEKVGMWVGAAAGVLAVALITVATGGTALGAIIPALVAGGAGAYAGHEIVESALPKTFYLPVYAISPEEIFQNKIGLLDVNFFNPNSEKYNNIELEDGQNISQISTAAELQSTISSWYLTLRNFAIVVLLIILLYTGIRIVTSSAAQDRAKYKEKLFSWIVAMCLLFFMHYIMSFAITIVQSISEGINVINKPIIVTMPDLQEKGYQIEIVAEDGTRGGVDAVDYFTQASLISDSGEYLWPTNLMGTLRIDMQMDENLTEDNQLLRQLGYVVLFLVLVFYTIAFLVVYIKRLIMLAFLTMIAPLVAMTYPIDKMNDGNAQAFNMWIKEYVFNLLIQPFHLILYTMLVGSAIDFAHNNMIYAIVAIGFIFQAEKILRKFFGFDKASTLDTNGSTVGGMLAMAGINQLKKLGSGKKGGKSGEGNKGNQKDSQRIRTADKGKSASERLEADNVRDNTGENQGTEGTEAQGTNSTRQLADPNKSEEWNRMYGDRIALNELREENGDNAEHLQTLDEWDKEIRESDTRGIGTWLKDEYQGSRLQTGINNTKDKISGAANSAVNWLSESAPGRFTRKIGGGINKGVTGVKNLGQRIRYATPKPIRNTLKNSAKTLATGAKGVGAVAGKGLKYAIPKAGKLYAKTALGLTAGAIGVAGGLASDNDMNILKYGGAGAATGWAVGSVTGGMIDKASHTVESVGENIVSTYTTAAHGQEAEKARLQAKEDKAAMKDKDRQKLYLEKVKNISKKQIKDVMKEAQEYRESGITDDKLIIKAMNAEGFGEGRANNERIILAGLANEVGNDNKKIKDLQSRLSERGLSEPDVKKYIDGIRDITGAV